MCSPTSFPVTPESAQLYKAKNICNVCFIIYYILIEKLDVPLLGRILLFIDYFNYM